MNKNIWIVLAVLVLAGLALFFYPLDRQTTDLAERAEQYCQESNVAAVEVSRDAGLIKVVSSLLGGGATYYPENGGQPTQCPVVAPNSMSGECQDLLNIDDWEMVCEPGTDGSDRPSDEEAELVGFNFILNFIESTPSDRNEQAEQDAYDALSQRAQQEVDEDSLLSDLAQFVGVQDTPDQGASVEDLQNTGSQTATLIVGLNYSGSGRVLRNVHLVIENGEWKVDRISVPEEAQRFDHVGNLTRNNPGMEEGVWYLVYEEPGAPALNVALEFTSSSVCAEGVENNTCNPDELTEGQRVHILGEMTEDDSVRVIRLQVQ